MTPSGVVKVHSESDNTALFYNDPSSTGEYNPALAGGCDVTIDGAAEAVVIAEMEKVRAALAKASGGSGSDWTSPTVGVVKWIPPGTFTIGSRNWNVPSGRGNDVGLPLARASP